MEGLGKKLDIVKTAAKELRSNGGAAAGAGAGKEAAKGRGSGGLTQSPSVVRGRGKPEPLVKVKTKEEVEEEEEVASERGFTLEDAYKYACKHLLRVYPAGWCHLG